VKHVYVSPSPFHRLHPHHHRHAADKQAARRS
jgi:hypothetical protein